MSSDSDSDNEVKIKEEEMEEEETEPSVVLKKPRRTAGKTKDENLTMNDYYNMLAKINKCNNKHKRKEDFLKAKRLKRKVSVCFFIDWTELSSRLI